MPQTTVAFAYGLIMLPIDYAQTHYHHTLLLRLYRRGYETVEVGSWELHKEIVWKRAADLRGREIALDDIFSGLQHGGQVSAPSVLQAKFAMPGLELNWNDSKRVDFNLQPGSESRAHKKALLFGADEYERLASSFAASTEELRDAQARLLAKAAWLRKRAAE